MRVSSFLIAIVAAFASLVAYAPSALGIEIGVVLSREQVYVGDSFIYQISLDGVSATNPPTIPATDAYRVEFLGGRDESSHSVSIINGRRSEESTLRYVMQWKITPLKAGKQTIPTVDLAVNGQTLSTPRTNFTALQPGSCPDYKVSLESDKSEAYVGEPIHMRITWLLGKAAQTPILSGSDGGDTYDILALEPPGGIPANPQQQDSRYPVIRFLEGQAALTRTQGMLDGRTVTAFTLDLVITPKQPGDIAIGPYTMVFDAVVGQREKSFFDAPWDNRSVTQRTVIATNAVLLHVKPLPTEGRPANFNGLIGDFTLTAASPTTEAAVGDPIPLTLTIRGPEPLNRVTAPDLATSIEPDFKPAPEGWEAGPVAMGSRTFTTTVRPRNDRVTQIPPIALPYFDAITGTYKAARSNPIPLKVKPSREVTAADALRPQANGSSAPSVPMNMNAAPAALTSLASGLGPNAESAAVLVNQRVSILALTRHPGFIAFLVAPPALLAIARWRPKRDPMRSAIANARRQLHSATSTQAIADALRTALGPALGIAPEAVTPQDLSPPAHGTTLLSPQIASEAVAILNAADAAAFGKASPDTNDLKRRASEVLDRLRTASPTFRRGERSAAR